MPKALRIKNVSSHGTLTVKELITFLGTDMLDKPVILKCGKNFRLAKMTKSGDTPVLVGKRSALK